MTDNLIGPKPEGPKYPTPWQAVDNDVYADNGDGVLILQVTPEGSTYEEDDQIAKAIVDAVNAYYGGTGPLQDTWVKACRDLDAKDARIAELEQKLHKLDREAWDQFDRLNVAENRAQGAQQRATSLLNDRNKWKKRAEAAEARVRDLEFQLEGATESLEESRGRVGELEQALEDAAEIASRATDYKGEPGSWEYELSNDRMDTFTAPDGRVFRVGQRVQDSVKPERIGTIRKFDPPSQGGQTPVVIRMDDGSKPHYNPEFLRRVWDGTEEPDVPVGTVLRDKHGCHIEKEPPGCEGWTRVGVWDYYWYWPNDQDGPYVEVLPEDD